VAIELDKGCGAGLHNFVPIIEGGQTVGLQCLLCPKTVREDMEQSSFVVSAKGIERTSTPFDGQQYHRKDPRF
jgi:hypothetical protein